MPTKGEVMRWYTWIQFLKKIGLEGAMLIKPEDVNKSAHKKGLHVSTVIQSIDGASKGLWAEILPLEDIQCP